MLFRLCLVILEFIFGINSYREKRPNIVFVIADDLGWNDVSFHGSNQILTPNVDALAYDGIILNSHYVQPICTPSRASLMTGKYPINIGMQSTTPIIPGETRGLPRGKILPNYFKDLGYSTHLIGKWHLGSSRWNQTPTCRGFDTFFGYHGGFVSYYDYLQTFALNGTDATGHDLWKNKEQTWDDVGRYATDVFTDEAVYRIRKHDTRKPLFLLLAHLAAHSGNEQKLTEAPQERINKFRHVIDAGRRTLAAMVSKLDDSMGDVVSALKLKGMLENTIIVFVSDNGAPTIGSLSTRGSNYPFKGMKSTLWEGGVRGTAFIWSPLLSIKNRVSNELMHISDWLPTLYSAAGGDVNDLDSSITGINQWAMLSDGASSQRREVLINIDEVVGYSAIRRDNWKLISGTIQNGSYDNYLGDSGRVNIKKVLYSTSKVYRSKAGKSIRTLPGIKTHKEEYEMIRSQATINCGNDNRIGNPCNLNIPGSVCLYNIQEDPCERNNVAEANPRIVSELKNLLTEYQKSLVPQANEPQDVNSHPRFFNYTWYPWLSDLSSRSC